MDLVELIPNLIAMLTSLAAAVMLFNLSRAMKGGQMGAIMGYLVVGIFLSVTVHAGFELANLFGFVSGEILFVSMGTLLSVGSVLFIIAGIKGLKIYR